MKKIGALAVLMGLPLLAGAQGSFEDFLNQSRGGFEQFRDNSRNDFEEFRRKINADYAAFLEAAWTPIKREEPTPIPEEPKPVPPVIFDNSGPEPKPNPIEIKRVVPLPIPKPAPKPIVPQGDDIQPNFELIPIKSPHPVKPRQEQPTAPKPVTQAVNFLGTPLNVRWNKSANFRLGGVSEKNIASGWSTLSDGRANNLLRDCLDLRESLNLTDWAYLQLLAALSGQLLGKDSNEAVLLQAWLYCQSGYKMRLASAASRLYMLFASEHVIYDLIYYQLDGTMFYPLNCNERSLNISSAAFPKEQPLSLIINSAPRLSAALSEPRSLTSKRYSSASFPVRINRNLLDFYQTYPSSYINGDIMTRWAMYANVPASAQIQEFVYPPLRKAIEGKGKREAAEVILNWVQTAFPYEYDEKVWGRDRAFFADETLYYPACDCEDRAILFSRLVRDLLGLDVMLVYYPGHLATAVDFNESEPRGDYLTYHGRRFTVCDPTYINAGTGRTMPGMDNSAAKVTLLTAGVSSAFRQ